jgi:hypothetical protein
MNPLMFSMPEPQFYLDFACRASMPAQKHFFLRRLGRIFGQAHLAMILHPHEMGILGRQGFWAGFETDQRGSRPMGKLKVHLSG